MGMSKRRQFWLTVFLGMLAALAPLATDMYLPALPVMQADFGISTSLTQLTLTMTMLGMALGQIFAGPVSDLAGRRGPLLAGMLVFCLATAGCMVVENIWLFLLCRFIAGFSGASGIVIARAIARDVCDGPELTRFFAILMMVNGLAPILAPVAGGQILLFTSWRGVFALLLVIGVLLVGAAFRFEETLPVVRRAPDMATSLRAFPELLHDRCFFGHCLLQCFIFGAFFSYIAGSSFVFQNVYGVSAQTYSLLFGFIGVGLMLAGSIPARLAGRIPDETLLEYATCTSFAGSVLLLFLFLCDAGLPLVLPVLFVTVVPLSVIGAASFSLALSGQRKNAGSASAILGFFSMILGGVMMPLVGIAGDRTPLPMAVLMVLGYGLGVVIFRRRIAPGRKYRGLRAYDSGKT